MRKLKLILTFCLILLFVSNPTYASKENYDAQTAQETKSDPIPILVYHLVSDNIFTKNTDLFVKPTEFENQLKWIIKNEYTPIFADTLSEGKNYDKPIVITFDDGYIDNYEVVFQLIKKYKIKITIFVITKMINTENHLTSDQITEMVASGLVSIQSHTVSHKYLTKLASEELTTELEKSKDELHKLTGNYPTVIAYPYGDINSEAIESVKKYYSLGYSTSKGNLSNGNNKFMITRYGVGRKTSIKNIQEYIDSVADAKD